MCSVPDGSCIIVDSFAFPPPVNGVWVLGAAADIRVVGPDGTTLQKTFSPPLEICLPFTAEDVAKVGGTAANLRLGWAATLGDTWELLPTEVNLKDMLACGQISHLSIFGIFEPLLPTTGFAPGAVTALGEPEVAYNATGMVLEIPSLGVSMPVVGVPESGDGWKVDWLGEKAGWLNGTSFPTWVGNTAVTGHVVDVDGRPGPFSMLHTLWWGDEVKLHAWGKTYTYEVRSAVMTTPDNLKMLKHEDLDWLTLLTCRGFDADEETYPWRTVVRAVLVDVK